MGSGFRVVLVSVPQSKLAEKIARGLVKNKLAACVTEIPQTTSHYYWEGKLEKTQEVVLLIKTKAGLLPKLMRFIKEKHGAKVPEIISLPIMEGDQAYLEWLGAGV